MMRVSREIVEGVRRARRESRVDVGGGTDALKVRLAVQELGYRPGSPEIYITSGDDDAKLAKALRGPTTYAFPLSSLPIGADTERAERHAANSRRKFLELYAEIDRRMPGRYFQSMYGGCTGGTAFAARLLALYALDAWPNLSAVFEVRLPRESPPPVFRLNIANNLRLLSGSYRCTVAPQVRIPADRVATVLYPADPNMVEVGGYGQIAKFRSTLYRGLARESDWGNIFKNFAFAYCEDDGFLPACFPAFLEANSDIGLVSQARNVNLKSPFAFEIMNHVDFERPEEVTLLVVLESPDSENKRVELLERLLSELTFAEEVSKNVNPQLIHTRGQRYAAALLLGPVPVKAVRCGQWEFNLAERG
jgi:hypothetical protein